MGWRWSIVGACCKKVAKSLEVILKMRIFAAELKTMLMEETKVTMKPNGLEMDINKQEFALALKTWRLRQGFTQKRVGEMWGCSRWTIMRAEAGKDITWEMAYRMFAKLSHELRKEAENG